MHNAVQFLSRNLATASAATLTPGSPVTIPVPPRTPQLSVTRPDRRTQRFPAEASAAIHYADTQRVGIYEVEPSLPGHSRFAVNLFNSVESSVAPQQSVTFGGDPVTIQSAEVPIAAEAWRIPLLAALAFLALEWVVYNRRL